MRRRVLFFTCELPPLAGLPVTGGGLRVHGIAEGLAAAGHEVVLSVPEAKLAEAGKAGKELAKHAHRPQELGRVIVDVRPDVLLFEQWGTATYLPPVDVPVVIDLHGALSLENAYRSGGDFTSDAFTKIEALAKADLLTCPGVFQRNYFLGWWVLAGADPRTARVEVVPVCLPPKIPRRPKRKGIRFVYSGAAWPWIDPFPGLEILAEKVGKAEGASLDLYLARPNIALKGGSEEGELVRYREIHERLGEAESVRILDPIPRDALLKEYLTAACAFDVYRRNPERELAFTTRTIEYLWSGVPVIYGNYGELAPLIARYEAGIVVDPEDAKGIEKAIDGLLADPARLDAMGRNAQALAREHFAWDRAVAPLAAFVERPVRREGKRSILAGYKSVMDGYWEKLHLEEVQRIEDRHREEIREHVARIDALHDRAAENTRQKDLELREVRAEQQKADQTREKALERVEAQRERESESHARELARRDEQLARLEAKFADLDRDYQIQLRQAADERREQVRAKDEELRVLREGKDRALASLEEELRRAREERDREIARRDDTITDLNRRIDEVQQIGEQRLQRQYAERTKLLEGKDREVEKAWAERDREVDKRDRQIVKLQDLGDELSRERSRLADLLQKADTERGRTESEVGRLEKELSDTREWAKSMEKGHDERVKKLETEIADTRAWAESVESGTAARVGALEQALADQEKAFTEAEQTFTAMEKTIGEQRDHIHFLGGEVERIQEDAATRIRMLEREREDRDRMLGQLDHVRRDLEARDRALRLMMNRHQPRWKLKVVRKGRKLFKLYPRLAWLFFVNLITNFYMERWQKKTKQQIFPGNVKAGS